MIRPAFDDDSDDRPLDPAVEKVRRKLIRFIAINLGLLLAALMAVGLAIVYKTRSAPPETELAGAPIESRLALPAGARIVSQSLSQDRIAVDAELADGSRAIFVYDYARQRLVARVAVAPQ